MSTAPIAGAMPPQPGTENTATAREIRRTIRNKRKHGRDVPTLIITIVVVSILLLLTVFPLIRVFSEALGERGLEVLTSMVSDPYPRQIILNTLVLGIVVGLAGTLIGFLLAFAHVRLDFKGKNSSTCWHLSPSLPHRSR